MSSDHGVKNYTDWDDFDAEAYVRHNYVQKILHEDRYILERVIKALHDHGAKPQAWEHVADVGTGPNFYPPMLLAPFVKPAENGGRVDLIEFSPDNRRYLEEVLRGSHPHSNDGCWHKFETAMRKECLLWTGAVQEVCEKAKVVAGSIFELPHEAYDAISSYFVAESITDDLETCKKAVNRVLNAVKPGGFISMAFMLGSEGYPAGVDTFFPAVAIDVPQLRGMYFGKADVEIVQVPAKPGARPGYTGMAVVTGKKL
ncbi:MAG: hypothetical protein AAB834_02150 [Patescibacteria group bacterium]